MARSLDRHKTILRQARWPSRCRHPRQPLACSSCRSRCSSSWDAQEAHRRCQQHGCRRHVQCAPSACPCDQSSSVRDSCRTALGASARCQQNACTCVCRGCNRTTSGGACLGQCCRPTSCVGRSGQTR